MKERAAIYTNGDSMNEIMINLKKWFIEQQIELHKELVHKAKLCRASDCKYLGGKVTYGFNVDDDKNFVINESESSVVKLIFELCSNGLSNRDIADELNFRCLTNKNGGMFSTKLVRQILKNEKYHGVYSYKNYIRIENGIPKIISDDLWQLTREKLAVFHSK